MQFGAGRRITERLFALFEGQQHDVFPGRHGVEVLGGLQRITQIAGPRHDELVGAMSLAHQVLGFGPNCLRHLSGATACCVMLP